MLPTQSTRTPFVSRCHPERSEHPAPPDAPESKDPCHPTSSNDPERNSLHEILLGIPRNASRSRTRTRDPSTPRSESQATRAAPLRMTRVRGTRGGPKGAPLQRNKQPVIESDWLESPREGAHPEPPNRRKVSFSTPCLCVSVVELKHFCRVVFCTRAAYTFFLKTVV